MRWALAHGASGVFEDELAEGVQMVRCVNPERLKFEVEYGMNRGGAEYTALATSSPTPQTLLC